MLATFRVGNFFKKETAQNSKRSLINLTPLKFRISALSKDNIRKMRRQQQIRKIHFYKGSVNRVGKQLLQTREEGPMTGGLK